MKPIVILGTLLLFLACTSEAEQTKALQLKEIKALEKEVIGIHDEVMPKTADINRMQRKIKGMLKDSTLNETTITSLRDQLVVLTKADDGMQEWMRNYKKPSKETPFNEVMTYLNSEKVIIQKVSDQMHGSLDYGEKLLKKLQTETNQNPE